MRRWDNRGSSLGGSSLGSSSGGGDDDITAPVSVWSGVSTMVSACEDRFQTISARRCALVIVVARSVSI